MDGRVLRGELNRRAIVDAALALVAEEESLPTAQALAQRAGVAKRSVFHHFPDLDSLFTEAADTQAARFWNLLEPPGPGLPLADRIEIAVGQRARLFEAIGDVRRVAIRHEGGSPTLANRVRESRAALRGHLRASLQPEISDLDPASVEGIQAMASWEAWEVLRRDQRLGVAGARRAVETVIEAAFGRVNS